MFWLRRLSIFFAFLCSISFICWAVPKYLDPTRTPAAEKARDRLWVNTSPYFIDRQVCRWVGLCGLHHLRKDPATRPGSVEDDEPWNGGELRKRSEGWEIEEEQNVQIDMKRNKQERRKKHKVLKEIPSYVMEHAPLVHLYSGEEFWPSDIKEHVEHMTPYVNDAPLNKTEEGPWNLHNLHTLNGRKGWITLRSDDDVESRPTWLHSHDNIPNPFDDDDDAIRQPAVDHSDGKKPKSGEPSTWFDVDKNHPIHRISDPRRKPKHRLVPRGHKPDKNGFSDAPAVLVVVDKGSGIVDAFWHFFYSYNLGQTVLGLRFGNHVGDWEHCMIRFENGVPRGLFLSEHEGGQAYTWEVMEKRNGRPVIYSAVGSHAMYALPGNHPYVLPFSLLKDITDQGPLWDPSLNNYAYWYDYQLGSQEWSGLYRGTLPDPESLTPAAKNPGAPTSWFHFRGRWGDDVYSLADMRQWRLFGQYHYVTGPSGPRHKALGRSRLCQLTPCRLLYGIDPKGTWY